MKPWHTLAAVLGLAACGNWEPMEASLIDLEASCFSERIVVGSRSWRETRELVPGIAILIVNPETRQVASLGNVSGTLDEPWRELRCDPEDPERAVDCELQPDTLALRRCDGATF